MATPEPDHNAASGPLGRLLDSLRRFLGSLVGIGYTRLELLAFELQLEVRLLARLLILALVALFAASMGVLLLGLAVIFAFWDTHRVLASVLVVVVFFAIALVAGVVLAKKSRSKPPLLEGTLAELAKDRELLRSKLRTTSAREEGHGRPTQ